MRRIQKVCLLYLTVDPDDGELVAVVPGVGADGDPRVELSCRCAVHA